MTEIQKQPEVQYLPLMDAPMIIAQRMLAASLAQVNVTEVN